MKFALCYGMIMAAENKLTPRKVIPPELCMQKVEDIRKTRSDTDGDITCNQKFCSVRCRDGYQLLV